MPRSSDRPGAHPDLDHPWSLCEASPGAQGSDRIDPSSVVSLGPASVTKEGW